MMDATQPFRPHIYGMSEMDYPNPETLGVSIFPKSRQQSFPQELEDQFKHMQSNFATGLFPSISRTWMAIDSDLFLWNFENNSDLAYFDGIGNTILLVDLCKPRVGFSHPDLHYLLVVATTVDILLLALTFRDEFGNAQTVAHTSFKNSYACLVGTPLYKLGLEGLIVTNLCCSQNGRIFFSADDCLYEMEYYDKTWYSGYTCKKINHSKSLLTSFIPALNIFSSRDEVRQVELDDSRHLLYVLFKKGNIQIFDLGVDGKSTQKFCTFQREQLEHDSTALCNVTSEYFNEVVSVNAVPLTSSYNNYFVLTTAKGVRVYMTCLEREIQSTGQFQYTQEHIRPKTVRIVQIKFPPSEQSFAFKGVNIYNCFISADTTLMASDLSSDQTNFWIFTSSNFAYSNRLDEHNIVLPMHGAVWKIDKAEMSEASSPQGGGIDPMTLPRENEPLIARQHLYPVEKFYVLTSKGVSTFNHLAPVEIFRKILVKYGPESKEFQTFVSLFPHSEVCVMAIIVLCGDNPMDISIKDIALRTFFVYGGEPQIHIATNGVDGYSNGYGGGLRGGASDPRPRSALGGWNLPSHLNSPKTPFQSPRLNGLSLGPLRTSTPQDVQTPSPRLDHFANTPFSPMGYGEQSIVAGSPTIVFSPRHDALHLYFQRILAPLGDRQLCYVENDMFTSSFSTEEVDTVTRFVAVYKRIIDEYALIGSTSSSMYHTSSRPHVSDSRDLAGRDQEKLSLSNLRNEINTILEVLRLWIILLEHDFNAIIIALPTNLQRDLVNWGFDDLFKNRDNICTDLITSIVRFYIGDDASTAAISKRLRELCPSIFTNDDALVVNATESLYRVKTTANAKERKELIDNAIRTFLQSIHKLNLVQTCDVLIQIGHFEGIVDLALAKADSDDKSKLALIFYKRQSGDVGDEAAELSGAMRKRNDAYACITDALELLQIVAQTKSDQSISSVTLNSSTFPSADCVKKLSAGVAKIERDVMLKRVFDSEDELANVAVFRWLLSHGMANIPLDRKCRFFKAYLLHEIEEGKGSKFLELLWKFNEKTGNYVEAAKVLFDMATRVGSRTTLNQRITQLSQALMCVQSDAETKSNIELKSEIQDTLDVAQIQMRTKNALESQISMRQPNDQRRLKEAIETLNHGLAGLTDIYDLYAKPFDLDEIKLDALHCAGHYDKDVVEQIWKSILDRELENFLNNSESEFAAKGRLGSLLFRMKRHFLRSLQFVPCQFILRNLLLVGFKRLVEPEWLPDICKASEISYSDLLSVASYEFRIGDPFWQQNQRALQFITDLVIVVCDRFKDDCQKISYNDSNVLRNACLDFLSDLLLNKSKNKKAKKLEALQSELERI